MFTSILMLFHCLFGQIMLFQFQDVRPMPAGNIGQSDPEWRFTNEYHPLWPNDYDKVVRGNYNIFILFYQ